MYSLCFYSPAGDITVASDGKIITGVDFKTTVTGELCPLLLEAKRQLLAYFEGSLTEFDLPLDPQGTEFQKRVWKGLCDIPYGKTISYRQLAENIGSPKAFRAAGQANRKNPVSIIIPCHRVVASDGSLGGYMGKWNDKKSPKVWLLEHERCVRANSLRFHNEQQADDK